MQRIREAASEVVDGEGWLAVHTVLVMLAERYGARLEDMNAPERAIFQAQGAKAALLEARSMLIKLAGQAGEGEGNG